MNFETRLITDGGVIGTRDSLNAVSYFVLSFEGSAMKIGEDHFAVCAVYWDSEEERFGVDVEALRKVVILELTKLPGVVDEVVRQGGSAGLNAVEMTTAEPNTEFGCKKAWLR